MKLHLLLVVIVFTLSSCNKKNIPAPDKTHEKVEAITPQNVSFKAFQTLAHNPANVIFSPISFKNTTTLLEAELQDKYKSKLEDIVGPPVQLEKKPEYLAENSVWTNQKRPINAKDVNEWVDKNSCGKKLKPYEKIDSKVSAILLSSLCFQGKFDAPFRKEDSILTHFFSSPHQTVTTTVMQRTHNYPYFEDTIAQWIELKFQNSPIALWLGLPKKDQKIEELEKKLSADYLLSIGKSLKPAKVEVVLPKFSFNEKTSFKEVLTMSGADFSFNKVNFLKNSRFSKLNFSEISQIAVFEINESGANISLDTASLKNDSKYKLLAKNFYAIKPFLAVLRNNNTNEVLMLGRVYKP